MAINTEILLREGRFIRRQMHEEDLGSQEHILSLLAQDTRVMLKNVFVFNDRPVHILASTNSLAMVTEITSLPFKTYFEPSADDPCNMLEPCFHPAPGSIQIDDPWIVPADFGKPLFVVSFARDAYSPTHRFVVAHAYLFLLRNKELFRLIYPNVFDDGRICMGNTWDMDRTPAKDVFSNFIHAYNSFQTSAMNDHLTRDITYTLFRRNLKGWVYPPYNTAFDDPTSVSFMQGFSI